MDAIKISSVPEVKLIQQFGSTEAGEVERDGKGRVGSLHLTPHHIIFRSTSSTSDVPSTSGETWIPLPLLYSISRLPSSLTGATNPLLLRTRDFKTYELVFRKEDEAEAVYSSVKALCSAVGVGGVASGFAFCYQGDDCAVKEGDTTKDKGKGRGWEMYDVDKEFARMGVGSRSLAWRISPVNADYTFCPSYPSKIVVPSKISDTTLSYAVKYRSKGRIPGLVYLHWGNLGSITRSSQPMVGLKNNRSIQDEKLIEAIFASHSQHSTAAPAAPRFTFSSSRSSSSSSQMTINPAFNATATDGIVYGAQSTNLIIDARPTTNAMANSVKGAGTENMEHYRNCRKAYLGIDNIHVMRSSLTGIYDALKEAELVGVLDPIALRRTGWLKHTSSILEGILVITRTIHLSNSHVLIHCSDGWDRTSQLSSLAQLCLDPYYRTAEGFAVLIEKDWGSFGHRFGDRTGVLCSDRTTFEQSTPDTPVSFLSTIRSTLTPASHAYKETSPVFEQFLDCAYQLLRQFPSRFEWNEGFLRRLRWEKEVGRTGTFLFNSEREREEMRGRDVTRSVWDGVFDCDGEGKWRLKEEWRNGGYDSSLDDPDARTAEADQGVLLVEPKDVKWWFELFGRSDEEMNGKVGPLGGEEDDVVVTIEDGEASTTPAIISAPSGLPRHLPTDSSSLPATYVPARQSSPVIPPPRETSSPAPTVSEAVSSVQKLGWGAWKGLQKSYQDTVVTYRESVKAYESGLEERRTAPRVEREVGEGRVRTESARLDVVVPPPTRRERVPTGDDGFDERRNGDFSSTPIPFDLSLDTPPTPPIKVRPVLEEASSLSSLSDPVPRTAIGGENPWAPRTTVDDTKTRSKLPGEMVEVVATKEKDEDPLGVGFS